MDNVLVPNGIAPVSPVSPIATPYNVALALSEFSKVAHLYRQGSDAFSRRKAMQILAWFNGKKESEIAEQYLSGQGGFDALTVEQVKETVDSINAIFGVISAKVVKMPNPQKPYEVRGKYDNATHSRLFTDGTISHPNSELYTKFTFELSHPQLPTTVKLEMSVSNAKDVTDCLSNLVENGGISPKILCTEGSKIAYFRPIF